MTMKYVSNEEIIRTARKNLSQGSWDYLIGGSESETTMRRNRLAFDRLAFRPRVLVDVSKIITSSTFLGLNAKIPVILAPIGSQETFTQEGAAAATKAASEFGVVDVISSVSSPTLEEISKAANNPKIFQLYIHGDWNWITSMINRVKESKYKALCITVDTAHYSRRERPMMTRFFPHSRRTPPSPEYAASVTWETIDKIKDYADIPLLLKGIATAEDAKLAIEHGANVIWVSNHGGRQLDYGQGSMEMLPEIVNVVQGKAEIVLDGGIQRGSDIAKALALGANAVAIGKMQCLGLAADGKEGLIRVLEILEEELIIAMALLGVTSVDQLSPNYICKSESTTQPHEMSTWVNIPENQIK
jgi:isopentenyl diphosphate isomerase/L-lactate dehydrogenase-like FMN-dependent dehydrogenase